MENKSLLVIRLSAMGDVAMTIPAIFSLAVQYPEWDIKVVTFKSFTELFVYSPANISLITVDKNELKGFYGLFRLVKLLVHVHPYLVADLHSVLRTWIIDFCFLLSGTKVRIVSKHRMQRLALKYWAYDLWAQPFTERYFDVFRMLGFELKPSFTSLFPGKYKAGRRMYKVGIAPFARYKNKIYPVDMMKEVVRMLSEGNDCDIYIFGGGENETAVMEKWKHDFKSVVYTSGNLSLYEELRVMSGLDIMLTMDSANMHLASLVSVRCISVWGSTMPQCGFLGWSQSKYDAVYSGCRCQPCTISGSDTCRYNDFHCMKLISPKRIYDKIYECLQS